MSNLKLLVSTTLVAGLFFSLDCVYCDVQTKNEKLTAVRNENKNDSNKINKGNSTNNKTTSTEDFSFTELKKIDFSKCKKLNVEEIQTKFIRPIWFVKTEGNAINVHITFKNEGERSFYKTPYLLQILLRCLKDNVSGRGVGGFVKILEDNAIKLDVSSSREDVIIDISCLSEHYELAMSLLTELLTLSNLTENDIERSKNFYLQSIKYQKVLPRWVAVEKLKNIVNIPEYRSPFEEAIKRIPTYTKDDIDKCYKLLFDPHNAEITVAGNVATEKLVLEFNKVFEKIKERHNDFKCGSCDTVLTFSSISEHTNVDNENATVFLTLPNIPLSNKDKFAIRLINRIFGHCGLSSRLFTNVREHQHLVYGIWSYFSELDLQKSFGVEAQTSPKYIKATIDAIKHELKTLIENGITNEELSDMKVKLIALHVLGTPAEIVSYIVQRRRDGATIKTIDDHWNEYAKLSVSDINQILKRVFDLNKLVIVSCGRSVPQVAKAQAHETADTVKTEHTTSVDTQKSDETGNVSASINQKKSAINSKTAFPIEEAVLDNGLRVVVCNMSAKTGTVYLTVGYRVGSADDPRDMVGASHFLEHVLFKESKNIPAGKMDHYLSVFNKFTNGYTSYDVTYYPNYCNKVFLDADLKIEAERMSNAKILDKTVEDETNVILAERERSYEGKPYCRYAWEATLKDLYLYSNYSYSILGYRDQIKSCTATKLDEHYKKFYKPNNAVILFSGDITLSEAVEKCKQNFDHIKPGDSVRRNRVVDPEDINMSRKLINRDANITQRMIGFYYKVEQDSIKSVKQEVIVSMINEMLFKGDASILSEVLCKKFDLGYDMYSHIDKRLYGNAYLLFHFLLKDNEVLFDDAEKFVYKTIEEFLRQKFPMNIQQRFEKLKQRLIYKYKLMLDDPEEMNNFILTELLMYGHTVEEFKDIINIIESISFDEFMNTAKNLLNEHNKTLVVLHEPINTSK